MLFTFRFLLCPVTHYNIMRCRHAAAAGRNRGVKLYDCDRTRRGKSFRGRYGNRQENSGDKVSKGPLYGQKLAFLSTRTKYI